MASESPRDLAIDRPCANSDWLWKDMIWVWLDVEFVQVSGAKRTLVNARFGAISERKNIKGKINRTTHVVEQFISLNLGPEEFPTATHHMSLNGCTQMGS